LHNSAAACAATLPTLGIILRLSPDGHALPTVVLANRLTNPTYPPIEEARNYATTYRLVQEANAPELRRDFDWLIQAHQVLRRHGQELCKRAKPLCARCPFAAGCGYFLAANGAGFT
jgi:hypothetical protein